MTAKMKFPNRVWLKSPKGWYSRAATDWDRDMQALAARSFEPGVKLTQDERDTLDIYNESLRLEAEPLERDLRIKHGHTLPVRRSESEKGSGRRGTRRDATFRMNIPMWMRRMLGV